MLANLSSNELALLEEAYHLLSNQENLVFTYDFFEDATQLEKKVKMLTPLVSKGYLLQARKLGSEILFCEFTKDGFNYCKSHFN